MLFLAFFLIFFFALFILERKIKNCFLRTMMVFLLSLLAISLVGHICVGIGENFAINKFARTLPRILTKLSQSKGDELTSGLHSLTVIAGDPKSLANIEAVADEVDRGRLQEEKNEPPRQP